MSKVNSAMHQVIGTVKGPGETGNEYLFITADNREVKIGEFVAYQAQQGEKTWDILGKIADRRLIDHLPDRIFADTGISPEAIAALVGFAYPDPEIYEVTVSVIGYFHPALGFINPRLTPDPGAKVYRVDDETLVQVVNKRQPGEIGAAHVGSLLLRPGGGRPRGAGCEGAGEHPHGDFGRHGVGEVLYRWRPD